MPALSNLDPSRRYPKRALLAGALSLAATNCAPGSQETPKPITAPKPGATAARGSVVTPVATIRPTEVVPTPEPKGMIWNIEIKRETLTKLPPLPRQESHPNDLLENPSFLVDSNGLFARSADGTIVELDPKTGFVLQSTKEQGVLLMLTPETLFFMRNDLKIYQYDRASKKPSPLINTPEAALTTGSSAPTDHYRYPLLPGAGFFSIPYAADPGGLYIYSFDGSYQEKVQRMLLAGVYENYIVSYMPGDPLFKGLIQIREPGKGVNISFEATRSRPLVSADGFLAGMFYAQNGNRQPFIFSFHNRSVRTGNLISINNSYDTTQPILLNKDVAVFEHRGEHGPFSYQIVSLANGQVQAGPAVSFPSEFFAVGPVLYHSVPARDNLVELNPEARTSKVLNNDIKAVDFLGQVVLGEKKVLLFSNWKTTGERIQLNPPSPNDKAKIYAIDANSGEKLWTYDAPAGLADNPNTLPFYPPQVSLNGSKLLLVGNQVQIIDVASGKGEPLSGYKDSSSARVVKIVGSMLYVQTMQKLFALRF